MKTKSYIFKGVLASMVLAGSLVSCSEDTMDNINKDNSHTLDAPARFILTDVITSTAQNNTGGDINTYMMSYVEHEVGVHNQLWRAEGRQGEPNTASTFNNTWANLYSTLKNARFIIDKCSEGNSEAKNYSTKGMGEVMAAYNSAILTDMFGDVPFTNAAQPTSITNHMTNDYMNPTLDKQETIYTAINAYLDAAITDLPKGDANSVGSQDLLYGGNTSLWLKFAYGLKARYMMHLLYRSANRTADLEKIIEYCNKSFASVSEQAAFNIYNGTNLNPTFDFQWSRDGLGASQSMANKLVARQDPRERRVYFDPNSWVQLTGTDDPAINLGPNGKTIQAQSYYTYSMFMYAQTAPVLLLSYHEVQFLKAEALARLGKTEEAQAVLKNAVVASIANTEVSITAALNAPTVVGYGGLTETTSAITPEEAATYFDSKVLPLFKANPLKEVMNQKYLGMWGANGESEETYNDVRRLKALGEGDFITLENPNKFPLRLPYGSDDTTTNPNVKSAFGDGMYVYSENVWWAGGTR